MYLKLSPLPLPGLLPSALATYTRNVDVRGTSAPVPGANKVAESARAAGDAATQAFNFAEQVVSQGGAREEQSNRLRVFLETVLEAFGDERLLWTSYISSGSETVQAAQKGELSEPEQWFEIVLECLHGICVTQDAADNIFSR